MASKLSLPVRARLIVAGLVGQGIEVGYRPATSPGCAHTLYLRGRQGEAFTVLVEASRTAILDAYDRVDNEIGTDPLAAISAIVRYRKAH